jgi:hypothetical protein
MHKNTITDKNKSDEDNSHNHDKHDDQKGNTSTKNAAMSSDTNQHKGAHIATR